MIVRLSDIPDAKPGVRALAERGIVCRRAESFERIAILGFVQANWPDWLDHAAAAFTHVPPRMYVAVYEDSVGGFACWDAMRPGVMGPMGVISEARGLGVGTTLAEMAAAALAHEGYAYGILADAGAAVPFFERVMGAMVIPGSEDEAPATQEAAAAA
jgi:hypothetical protein